ncbi:MAG: hypothetical protein HYR96_15980 [Deltaproteobacteria bacterium]|nr:hypothetical protein [Deltaproteobacteria bacterium]
MKRDRTLKKARFAVFALCSIFAVVYLLRSGLDEERVALSRWTQLLSTDREFIENVESQCSMISGVDQTDGEAAFLRAVNLSQGEGGSNRCQLRVASKNLSRFGLQSLWNFTVQLKNQEGFVFQKAFSVSFPLPGALAPLIVWALALAFGIRFSLVWAIVAYVSASAAFNPARLSLLIVSSASRMMITEKHFLSLCALYFWSLLMKHSIPRKLMTWPRPLGVLLGVWHPSSLAGVFPLQYSKTFVEKGWIEPILCATLSAYFLVPQWDALQPWLTSLMLPRYFTFAVILFLGTRSWLSAKTERQPVCLWLIIRSVLACILVEGLAREIPTIGRFDLFLRLTLTINVALIATPGRFNWKAIVKNLLVLRWPALGLFVSAFTLTTGLGDVLLEYCNPLYHPNTVVLCTFLAGLLMGTTTGNFSYSFFQLLPLLAKYHSDSLVQAALVDGVTAGTLLSPFHPIVLMTFGYFDQRMINAYKGRISLLWPALVVGIVIYSLSSLKGIIILQPITFTFLCLLFAAAKLKENRWSFASA